MLAALQLQPSPSPAPREPLAELLTALLLSGFRGEQPPEFPGCRTEKVTVTLTSRQEDWRGGPAAAGMWKQDQSFLWLPELSEPVRQLSQGTGPPPRTAAQMCEVTPGSERPQGGSAELGLHGGPAPRQGQARPTQAWYL